MAFVNQPDEEDITRQGLTGAPSPPMTGATGGVSGTTPARTEKGGSQFSDPSRYLAQNQAAGQRFASRIGGNVLNAGNQARGAIAGQEGALNQARTNFNQAYQANQPIGSNPELLGRVSRFPTAYPGTQVETPVLDRNRGNTGKVREPLMQTSYTPPTINPEEAASYQSMLGSTYGGPQDLGFNINYDPLNALASQATGLADQYKTFTGREDLLGGLNKPNYSDASRNLDAILLGSAPSQRILQSASNQNQDINDRLSALRSLEGSSQEEAMNKAAGSEAMARGTREAAQTAGNEGYQALMKDYQNRLTSIPQRGRGPKRTLASNQAQNEYLQKIAALNQLIGGNYGL